MRKLWNVPVLLLAAIICSCSTIKEERSLCPCWYTIDFTEVDRSLQHLYLWIFNQEGILLCCDTLSGEEYGKYNVKLDKDKAYCYVWGNISQNSCWNESQDMNSYFTKADSCSSDPLFHYAKVLDTSDETGGEIVVLQKEYALVELVVKGKFEYSQQLQLEIIQPERGRYLHGGFVEGKSVIYAEPELLESDFSKFEFRMMRQSSLDGIIATITALRGDKRVVLKKIPLGEWLENFGYNIRAKNMADIKIEMDLAVGIVSIMIDNWQIVLPENVEM